MRLVLRLLALAAAAVIAIGIWSTITPEGRSWILGAFEWLKAMFEQGWKALFPRL